MTAYRHWTVRRHWLQAKTNDNEGCNSCATIVQVLQDLFYGFMFYCMFYFTYDRSFKVLPENRDRLC